MQTVFCVRGGPVFPAPLLEKIVISAADCLGIFEGGWVLQTGPPRRVGQKPPASGQREKRSPSGHIRQIVWEESAQSGPASPASRSPSLKAPRRQHRPCSGQVSTRHLPRPSLGGVRPLPKVCEPRPLGSPGRGQEPVLSPLAIWLESGRHMCVPRPARSTCRQVGSTQVHHSVRTSLQQPSRPVPSRPVLVAEPPRRANVSADGLCGDLYNRRFV